MILKHKFPSYIFFFFEQKKNLVWTNNTSSVAHYHQLFSIKQISLLFCIFSKELYMLSYLIDIFSFINNKSSSMTTIQKNIIVYTLHFILLNITLSITCFVTNFVPSIDYIYSNSNWLEREVSEMNELFFYNKFDTRKLLLNYSDNFAPLKNDNFIKNKDLFYNVFENQVTGLNSAVVEL